MKILPNKTPMYMYIWVQFDLQDVNPTVGLFMLRAVFLAISFEQQFLFNNYFLHTVKWFEIFLSNTNNLHMVIRFQVFLSNTNNLYTGTLPVKSIWPPSKIFISHPKSVIFNKTSSTKFLFIRLNTSLSQ